MLAALDHVDAAACAWVVGHRVHALDGIVWLLSTIARGGLLFVAIAAIISLQRRRWSELLAAGTAILISAVLIDHILKPVAGRERPFERMPAIDVIGSRPQNGSFPSGHAGNGFAGAVVLTHVAPRGAPLWWSVAAAVAYSRVYLGVHYPGDVIAGALLGAAIGAVVSGILRVQRPR